MRAAFPDLRYQILDMVVGRDAVAVYVRASGTHRGDFFGLPATGRAFAFEQMQIERFRDGRIAEHWRVSDMQTLMQQLTS
jgi:predicted ester cyclase